MCIEVFQMYRELMFSELHNFLKTFTITVERFVAKHRLMIRVARSLKRLK